MADNEVDIVMPPLAETVVEGEIIAWHVAEGESIARDAPLLEVASDKATVELPSPHSGVLLRQLAAVGDMVDVGAAIATMRLADSAPAAAEPAADDGAGAASPAEDADTGLFSADEPEETVRNPFAGAAARQQQTTAQASAAAPAQPQAGHNRYGRVLAVPAARI